MEHENKNVSVKTKGTAIYQEACEVFWPRNIIDLRKRGTSVLFSRNTRFLRKEKGAIT